MLAIPDLFALQKSNVAALEVLSLLYLLTSGSSASCSLLRFSELVIATQACSDLQSAMVSGSGGT